MNRSWSFFLPIFLTCSNSFDEGGTCSSSLRCILCFPPFFLFSFSPTALYILSLPLNVRSIAIVWKTKKKIFFCCCLNYGPISKTKCFLHRLNAIDNKNKKWLNVRSLFGPLRYRPMPWDIKSISLLYQVFVFHCHYDRNSLTRCLANEDDVQFSFLFHWVAWKMEGRSRVAYYSNRKMKIQFVF